MTPLCKSRTFLTYAPPLERNTEFRAHFILSSFNSLHLEMRVDSPVLCGKQSRRSCRNSRGGQSHIETRQETSWVVPQSQRHRFPHPLEIRPDLNGTPTIELQHQGARTPRLHSPEKATSSKCNSTRGLTPHSQLEREPEFHASMTRRGLPPLFKLHRNPEIDVRNGEEP